MASNSQPKSSFHMSPEEFRKHGHQVVDWVADYFNRVESYPIQNRWHPDEADSY